LRTRNKRARRERQHFATVFTAKAAMPGFHVCVKPGGIDLKVQGQSGDKGIGG